MTMTTQRPAPAAALSEKRMRPRWRRLAAAAWVVLSLGFAAGAAEMPGASTGTLSATTAHRQPMQTSQPPQGVAPAEWRSVQQQISAHQHRFVPQPDGSVQADSPAQGWQARFDGSGQVQVQGGQPAKPWQMRLKLQGVGYGPSLQAPGAAPVMTVQGDELHYRWSDQRRHLRLLAAREQCRWRGCAGPHAGGAAHGGGRSDAGAVGSDAAGPGGGGLGRAAAATALRDP